MKHGENFFLKSSAEKNKIFDEMRTSYSHWKKEMQDINKPFFAVHTDFKHLFLKNISGGALKLYLYLGFHAKHYTGELWHSSAEIANYFNKDQRTINTWFKELENIGLIFREQKGFKMKSNTFLQPYGFKFNEIMFDPTENHTYKQILVDIEMSKTLNLTPQFALILNHFLKEFTVLIIYKENELYHCSYFLNFNDSETKLLRYHLKNLGIKSDNFDIETSLVKTKNKELSLYTVILKYLDSER